MSKIDVSAKCRLKTSNAIDGEIAGTSLDAGRKLLRPCVDRIEITGKKHLDPPTS